MTSSTPSSGRLTAWLLVALPLVKLAVHLAVGNGYGYHGDEVYFLACADHLGWGYVDHPPFSIAVLAVWRALAGQSPAAIRVVPAIAGALTTLLVGLTARRLGAGAMGVGLAMLAALVAPFYLSLDAYFSMNAIDILLWATAGWLFLTILQGDQRTGRWIALGAVIGISLLNKLSGLWLAGGLFVGLFASRERGLLRTSGPWIAAACAGVIFLPHVVWQIANRFPTAIFMYHSTQNKIAFTTREYLRDGINGMLPVAAPVWLAGLAFYLIAPQGRGLRAIGWAWLAVFVLLAFSKASRDYYLAPSFTWLLPAGGAALDRWLTERTRWLRWAAVPYALAITAAGANASPLVLPILPEATISARSLSTGEGRRVYDTIGLGELPEFLGHMTGSVETVDAVERAYRSLPQADQGRAPILGVSYRVAGAVDVLGPARGLPPASSGHNSYWLWGPHGTWDGPIVVAGMREPRLREWFAEVTFVEEVQCRYCRTKPPNIWIVRGLKRPFPEFWRQLRDYE